MRGEASRGRRGRVLLALAALLASACADARPRNLLLISLDTLRADHLGSYGYPRPTSPFLDGLARDGVVFEQAFATAPWTLPSHTSLLTGLYPSQHGVIHEGFSLPAELPTLAQTLREQGFATAAVVSAHFLDRRYGLDRGFERYVSVPTNPRRGGAAASVSATGLDWLSQREGRPFFLFLHYMDIHSDYAPSPENAALFARPYRGVVDGSTRQLRAVLRGQLAFDADDRARLIDLYDAEIRQLDDALAKLFARLRERGELERTLVVVTSDHGEEFFEHGSVLHGQSHHRELLHVPLIVSGAAVPKGVRVARPVSVVDVVPTLLALLRAPLPGALPGRDLAALWREQDPVWPERSLYAEADRTVERRDTQRAVMRGRWKLVVHREGDLRELYDVEADPQEQRNLADAEPARASELAGDLGAALAGARPAPALPALDAAAREQLRALGYLKE